MVTRVSSHVSIAAVSLRSYITSEVTVRCPSLLHPKQREVSLIRETLTMAVAGSHVRQSMEEAFPHFAVFREVVLPVTQLTNMDGNRQRPRSIKHSNSTDYQAGFSSGEAVFCIFILHPAQPSARGVAIGGGGGNKETQVDLQLMGWPL